MLSHVSSAVAPASAFNASPNKICPKLFDSGLSLHSSSTLPRLSSVTVGPPTPSKFTLPDHVPLATASILSPSPLPSPYCNKCHTSVSPRHPFLSSTRMQHIMEPTSFHANRSRIKSSQFIRLRLLQSISNVFARPTAFSSQPLQV